jgi:hypothetical protein
LHMCICLRPTAQHPPVLFDDFEEEAPHSVFLMQDSPGPTVGPEAVLARQLLALQQGDVEASYAFASPANRASTGPIDRFATLLESPIYRPLTRHLEHEVSSPCFSTIPRVHLCSSCFVTGPSMAELTFYLLGFV